MSFSAEFKHESSRLIADKTALLQKMWGDKIIFPFC